jgi:transposase
MAGTANTKRKNRKSRTKSRNRRSLQKPNGVISPRVAKVGGERFAIVCIDPAKNRSEWMMADYFGNVIIPPRTLEHQAAFFKIAFTLIREAQEKHNIEDLVVSVERTGIFHLLPKRAFAKAGFETRVIHPFATKQFRMPANPGNKTDETDLHAQHRAAVAGFGLREIELESPYRELQVRIRHRRNLIEKATSIACQIKDHMHLSLPGYAMLFDHFFEHQSALAIARRCDCPSSVLELGHPGLRELLHEQSLRYQVRTIDKILAWASQAEGDSLRGGKLHHAVWTDLEALYQQFRRRVFEVEREIAHDLVKTPYVRLMALPGINVVLAADLAGEMGPMHQYADANAITGRAGLFPSRSQSDQSDNSGPIIRQSNRRIRSALMRIAESLACHCSYYRGIADTDKARGMHTRKSRVKTAKKFSRVAFQCVAGDEPMKHLAFRQPNSIIEKLREFHHVHQTPIDQTLADLKTVVEQLPYDTRHREAAIVSEVLRQNAKRKRGTPSIGALLPAVLARLGVGNVEIENETEEKSNIGDRS